MNKFANLNRRRHTPVEKLDIVLEALKQEQSVAQLAQQYEINANQLTRWIKEYREGAGWADKAQNKFVPVTITSSKRVDPLPVKASAKSASRPVKNSKPSTCVTVEFDSGHRLTLSSPTLGMLKHLVEALA